jgi:hypothetical protein
MVTLRTLHADVMVGRIEAVVEGIESSARGPRAGELYSLSFLAWVSSGKEVNAGG